MSFPQRTKFLKRPIGWEDLGELEGVLWRNSDRNERGVKSGLLCEKCFTWICLGRDDNKHLFRFCPRCEKKIMYFD